MQKQLFPSRPLTTITNSYSSSSMGETKLTRVLIKVSNTQA
jgi:hypothetical protein